MRKCHYSAEAEYMMNATEAEASADYFLPSFYLLVSKGLLLTSLLYAMSGVTSLTCCMVAAIVF